MTGPRAGDGYHHGALRQALIDATEGLLAERGADGFSLREVARRAGVSPAAPAHHFGDAAGLLSAVAANGFEELARRLAAAQASGDGDARRGLRAQGLAYVGFALDRPGLFRLMFRSGQLRDDEALTRHGRAAYQVLADGVAQAAGRVPGGPPAAVRVTALWSLVHGYAHLAIAGKLTDAKATSPPTGDDRAAAGCLQTQLAAVLDAVLDGLFPRPPASRRPPAH